MANQPLYKSLALALVLELVALVFTISANKSKRIFVVNSVNQVVSKAYNYVFSLNNYFYLKTENKKLIKSNQQLLTKEFNCKKLNDTIYNLVYADVVKNSINRANNLLVISAGANQGIKPGDGVISDNGTIVGTVLAVGKNYSSVLSILNQMSSISVLHKKSQTLCELSWTDVATPIFMNLEGIPTYVPVKVGDTIITSGYSLIWPKGLFVGTVYSVRKSKTAYRYKIKVRLASDMSRLQHIFVIKNRDKTQIEQVLAQAQKIIK